MSLEDKTKAKAAIELADNPVNKGQKDKDEVGDLEKVYEGDSIQNPPKERIVRPAPDVNPFHPSN